MKDKIRSFIITNLSELATKRNLSLPPQISDTYSLFEDAGYDSMDFYTLLVALENEFGVFCDFGDVEPEVFYTIGGLTDCMLNTLKNVGK